MKAYKIEILVIDLEEYGVDEIRTAIEDIPQAQVICVEEAEIGDWRDDHPLNNIKTFDAEYKRIFSPEKQIENSPTPKEEVDSLSHEEMCRLFRFTRAGEDEEKYFDSDLPYWVHFEKRFKELGGFSPEISKKIGWDG